MSLESLDSVVTTDDESVSSESIDLSSSGSSSSEDEAVREGPLSRSVSTDSHLSGDDTPTYSTREDYADQLDNRERTSDDIDPRRLVRNPSIDEIRWYTRWTPFAPTVVRKPILDAFKHGYTIKKDYTNKVTEFLDDWEPARQEARIAARRDGFSFIYYRLEDDANASESPENVRGYDDFEVLTIDDLAYSTDNKNTAALTRDEIAATTEYRPEQLRRLDQGIVIVEDITSEDHHDIVGAIYEVCDDDPNYGDGTYRFIHADRLQHFVENPHVDGPVDKDWVGAATGHPVLGPIFHELKSLTKTSWSLGQTLYRHTSPLHVVEMPDNVSGLGGDIEDHQSKLNAQLRNVNAASSITLPPGHEMKGVGQDAEIDPSPFIEALVEMVCAGSEFTKTVLMGTQSGTVSGSESDIKNYFNQVQRYRQTTAIEKMEEAVGMMRSLAPNGVMPNISGGFDVEYGPLFKLDQMDTSEAMVRMITAISNGINSYLLEPDEARSLLASEWASLGADIEPDEIEDLTEEEYDQLDRINVQKNEQTKGTEEAEVDPDGNPRVGNTNQRGEGGMEQGQTQTSRNPSAASTDSLDDGILDAIETLRMADDEQFNTVVEAFSNEQGT